MKRRRRRAKKNPLFSPTEEVVMTVLGVGALIGIAYYISVKNAPSGNTLAQNNPGGIVDPNPSPAPGS